MQQTAQHVPALNKPVGSGNSVQGFRRQYYTIFGLPTKFCQVHRVSSENLSTTRREALISTCSERIALVTNTDNSMVAAVVCVPYGLGHRVGPIPGSRNLIQ